MGLLIFTLEEERRMRSKQVWGLPWVRPGERNEPVREAGEEANWNILERVPWLAKPAKRGRIRLWRLRLWKSAETFKTSRSYIRGWNFPKFLSKEWCEETLPVKVTRLRVQMLLWALRKTKDFLYQLGFPFSALVWGTRNLPTECLVALVRLQVQLPFSP